MRRMCFAIVGIAVTVVSVGASAAEDPILTRKKLMQANGGAAGIAQGMIKGEIPFSPVLAESALRTFNAVAYSAGDYFPAGSDKGDTRASPKIWEEMAEFQEYLGNFQKATDAGRAAKPETLEAFQAAMGDIGKACGACHEDFRLEQN